MNIVLYLPALATFSIFIISVYVLYVAAVVTGRMTRTTSFVKRIAVVLSGGMAAWALEKCVTMTWTYTISDIILALTIAVIGAGILSQPRIKV